MVNVVDVILAKSLTSQGQVDTYAAKSKKSAEDAAAAAQSAEAAVNNINSIIEDTLEANEMAKDTKDLTDSALEQVNQALELLQNNTDIIDEEIDNLLLAIQDNSDNSAIKSNLSITYPSGKIEYINNLIKMYKSYGSNADGSMTQKAITDYVNQTKSELATRIEQASTTSGGKKFSVNDAGKIVVIDSNGELSSGTILESDIISALIQSGEYNITDTVGLQIDYSNRSFTRIHDAENKTAGENFNSYSMYGGRMRCNVTDNGTITAFYGDSNYKEDGSNGQVMVYQPKFYYQRIPISTDNMSGGKIIRKETIALSETEQPGFKIHPLFINENNEVVDYVLLPAYQGSIYDSSATSYDASATIAIDFSNDKLSSIAGVKPIGSNDNSNLTVDLAEKLAKNRGDGWHITNMAVESANQMLLMVEYGQLNGQNAIEKGVTDINNNITTNCASLTGSTSFLGNASGTALSTINDIEGNQISYSVNGKRSISYRGVENPWGNIYHFVGGTIIYSTDSSNGGDTYICNNFNYSYNELTNNYKYIGFHLPSDSSWINGIGYGDQSMDWVFMPIECRSGNSALPVGDNLWVATLLNGMKCLVIGGSSQSGNSAGPFYYGCDRPIDYFKYSFGANLMFIPKKDTIYMSNINKWQSKYVG